MDKVTVIIDIPESRQHETEAIKKAIALDLIDSESLQKAIMHHEFEGHEAEAPICEAEAVIERQLYQAMTDPVKILKQLIFKHLGLLEFLDKNPADPKYAHLYKAIDDDEVPMTEQNYARYFKEKYQAKLSMDITFAQSKLMDDVIKKLPPAYFQTPWQIKLSELGDFKLGRWNDDTQIMEIAPDDFDTEMIISPETKVNEGQKVFIHEIGHKIDHMYGYSKNDKWRTLSGWTKEKGAPDTIQGRYNQNGLWKYSKWNHSNIATFITEYAPRNPKEDFAETFAYFMLGLNDWFKIRDCQAKADFIRQFVVNDNMQLPELQKRPASTDMDKAVIGQEMPGHKYVKREGAPKHYIYTYGVEQQAKPTSEFIELEEMIKKTEPKMTVEKLLKIGGYSGLAPWLNGYIKIAKGTATEREITRMANKTLGFIEIATKQFEDQIKGNNDPKFRKMMGMSKSETDKQSEKMRVVLKNLDKAYEGLLKATGNENDKEMTVWIDNFVNIVHSESKERILPSIFGIHDDEWILRILDTLAGKMEKAESGQKLLGGSQKPLALPPGYKTYTSSSGETEKWRTTGSKEYPRMERVFDPGELERIQEARRKPSRPTRSAIPRAGGGGTAGGSSPLLGKERPGHKYIRREGPPGGPYKYVYQDTQGKEYYGPTPTGESGIMHHIDVEQQPVKEPLKQVTPTGKEIKPEQPRHVVTAEQPEKPAQPAQPATAAKEPPQEPQVAEQPHEPEPERLPENESMPQPWHMTWAETDNIANNGTDEQKADLANKMYNLTLESIPPEERSSRITATTKKYIESHLHVWGMYKSMLETAAKLEKDVPKHIQSEVPEIRFGKQTGEFKPKRRAKTEEEKNAPPKYIAKMKIDNGKTVYWYPWSKAKEITALYKKDTIADIMEHGGIRFFKKHSGILGQEKHGVDLSEEFRTNIPLFMFKKTAPDLGEHATRLRIKDTKLLSMIASDVEARAKQDQELISNIQYRVDALGADIAHVTEQEMKEFQQEEGVTKEQWEKTQQDYQESMGDVEQINQDYGNDDIIGATQDAMESYRKFSRMH